MSTFLVQWEKFMMRKKRFVDKDSVKWFTRDLIFDHPEQTTLRPQRDVIINGVTYVPLLTPLSSPPTHLTSATFTDFFLTDTL